MQTERLEAEELYRSAAGLRGGIAKIAQLRAYLQGHRRWDRKRSKFWVGCGIARQRNSRKPSGKSSSQSWGSRYPRFSRNGMMNRSPQRRFGQVHPAVSHDGILLAVKVQYPGSQKRSPMTWTRRGFCAIWSVAIWAKRCPYSP